MTVKPKIKTINVKVPPGVINIIVEATLYEMGASITKKDLRNKNWIARSGITWRSIGVNMNVSVIPFPGECSIEIKVEPIVNTIITITDTGASAEAIKTFEKILTKNVYQLTPEIEKRLTNGEMCPNCGRELQPGTLFCPDDGTAISNPCKKCGKNNPMGTKFCSNCGNKL